MRKAPPRDCAGRRASIAETKLSERRKSYEDRLGDGLENVLSNGADSLESIARGLNEINVSGPKGEKWDEDLLATELTRLGREPDDR